MGRPTTVTLESVSNTANKIQAAGLNPTVRLIQLAIGGTPSMNTIYKHFRAWEKSQEPAEPVAAVILNEEVTLSINQHVADSVHSATLTLKAQVAEKDAEATMLLAEYEAMTNENTSNISLIKALESNNHGLLGQMAQLKLQVEQLTRDLESQRQSNAQLIIEKVVTKEKINHIKKNYEQEILMLKTTMNAVKI